jgi:hypothetical protein
MERKKGFRRRRDDKSGGEWIVAREMNQGKTLALLSFK